MNDIELFNEGMKMIDVDTTKAFENSQNRRRRAMRMLCTISV